MGGSVDVVVGGVCFDFSVLFSLFIHHAEAALGEGEENSHKNGTEMGGIACMHFHDCEHKPSVFFLWGGFFFVGSLFRICARVQQREQKCGHHWRWVF